MLSSGNPSTTMVTPTNRRDIGVAALRTTVPDRVQDPIYPRAFCVLGITFRLIPAILISRRLLID